LKDAENLMKNRYLREWAMRKHTEKVKSKKEMDDVEFPISTPITNTFA